MASNASGITTGPDKTFTTLPAPTTEPGEEVSPPPPPPVSITPPITLPILPIPVFPPERPVRPPPVKCKKGFVKKGAKCVKRPHRKATTRKK